MAFRSIFFILMLAFSVFGQGGAIPIEVVPAENEASLVERLPNIEQVRSSAKLIKTPDQLRAALGDQPVLKEVNFKDGSVGATAEYPEGRLLVIEYNTPQLSADADSKFRQFLIDNPQNPAIYTKRIGNYSVFAFNAADEASANALIDQVKYQKVVQWLGEDPHWYRKAERYYLETTSDAIISSFIAIVLGLGTAIVIGSVVGFMIFRFRRNRKVGMAAFSDAGGMIRLNLDGLAEDTVKLLKD